MEDRQRIQGALKSSLGVLGGARCPRHLREAIEYAVFPSGGLIRPRLCLAVAKTCGDPWPDVSDAVAAALELMHCASLVHDDLPCFDNAAVRRGKPSVHKAFGEELAILAGDSLIVLACEQVALACTERTTLLPKLLLCLTQATGAVNGLIAGQAWEREPNVDLDLYHQTKTGALFEAAMVMGATSCGCDGEPFRQSGRLLGQAYQIADDIADRLGQASFTGKPVGQDANHGRLNAVETMGIQESTQRLSELVCRSYRAIPKQYANPGLEQLFVSIASRLLPKELSTQPISFAASGLGS